jgi:hypothetical protein
MRDSCRHLAQINIARILYPWSIPDGGLVVSLERIDLLAGPRSRLRPAASGRLDPEEAARRGPGHPRRPRHSGGPLQADIIEGARTKGFGRDAFWLIVTAPCVPPRH